jgi:uncharacterized tellurite resistance protein B-like protein
MSSPSPVPDPDRTLAICDLLLGAAHADSHFHDQERDSVRDLLADLHGGGELPAEVEKRIAGFDASAFDLARSAALFRGDSADEKRRLLHLVAAIHDADEELDLAEDDYLRALGTALELPAEDLKGLALEFEVQELRDSFTRLRSTPPPIPGAARSSKATPETVDIDIED